MLTLSFNRNVRKGFTQSSLGYFARNDAKYFPQYCHPDGGRTTLEARQRLGITLRSYLCGPSSVRMTNCV
jgi:hypothetical protein